MSYILLLRTKYYPSPESEPLTSPALLAAALTRDVVAALGVPGVAVTGVGTAQSEGVLVAGQLTALALEACGAGALSRH